jgi:hypothetical protein
MRIFRAVFEVQFRYVRNIYALFSRSWRRGAVSAMLSFRKPRKQPFAETFSPKEILMRSSRNRVALGALTVCAAMRRATHKLARRRKALDNAKVNTANVWILARGGKVSLDSTVLEASQIQLASSMTSGVHGVSSVSKCSRCRWKGIELQHSGRT